MRSQIPSCLVSTSANPRCGKGASQSDEVIQAHAQQELMRRECTIKAKGHTIDPSGFI